jgi:hypothetical protein
VQLALAGHQMNIQLCRECYNLGFVNNCSRRKSLCSIEKPALRRLVIDRVASD